MLWPPLLFLLLGALSSPSSEDDEDEDEDEEDDEDDEDEDEDEDEDDDEDDDDDELKEGGMLVEVRCDSSASGPSSKGIGLSSEGMSSTHVGVLHSLRLLSCSSLTSFIHPSWSPRRGSYHTHKTMHVA